MPDRQIVVDQHDTEIGSWGVAETTPDPRLSPYIVRYDGYWEDSPGAQRRRHLPSGLVTLIFGLDDKLRMLSGPGAETPGAVYTSFVAGLHETPAVSEHDGHQRGVEVKLSPLGARTLLGVSMDEIANTMVTVDDVLGADGERLADRLASARSWDERFAALDDMFGAAIDRGPAVSSRVAWAWSRLRSSAGTVPIGGLVDQLGVSRRHLAALFRREVGLTPKAAARVLRFERALGAFDDPRAHSLADVAAGCGYYDQAHLNREFRTLAGCTPTEYLAARLPGGATLA